MLGGVSAAAMLAYWVVADVRIVRTLRTLPTARKGVGLADASPPPDRVCVVTPAHNEERLIAQHLESLAGQRYEGELGFVVVLDRCTDGTADLVTRMTLDDPRFEVMALDRCPEPWAGKVHAIWHAVKHSQRAQEADVLVFVDADTELDPDLVRASVALARSRGLEMLSLWSTLRVEHWFEWLVQPACALELAYEYPLLRANRAEGRRAFANGQFILFDAHAYHRLGGHEAVRDAILEDMALARLAAQRGMPAGVLFDDGMIGVRMYARWEDFQTGWKRIFIDCASRNVRRMHRASRRLALSYALLPALTIAGLVAAAMADGSAPVWVRASVAALAVPSILAWLGTLGYIYARAGYPLWAVPLHPIGACMASRIMRRGASDLIARRPVRWGGRQYVLEPR